MLPIVPVHQKKKEAKKRPRVLPSAKKKKPAPSKVSSKAVLKASSAKASASKGPSSKDVDPPDLTELNQEANPSSASLETKPSSVQEVELAAVQTAATPGLAGNEGNAAAENADKAGMTEKAASIPNNSTQDDALPRKGDDSLSVFLRDYVTSFSDVSTTQKSVPSKPANEVSEPLTSLAITALPDPTTVPSYTANLPTKLAEKPVAATPPLTLTGFASVPKPKTRQRVRPLKKPSKVPARPVATTSNKNHLNHDVQKELPSFENNSTIISPVSTIKSTGMDPTVPTTPSPITQTILSPNPASNMIQNEKGISNPKITPEDSSDANVSGRNSPQPKNFTETETVVLMPKPNTELDATAPLDTTAKIDNKHSHSNSLPSIACVTQSQNDAGESHINDEDNMEDENQNNDTRSLALEEQISKKMPIVSQELEYNTLSSEQQQQKQQQQQQQKQTTNDPFQSILEINGSRTTRNVEETLLEAAEEAANLMNEMPSNASESDGMITALGLFDKVYDHVDIAVSTVIDTPKTNTATTPQNIDAQEDEKFEGDPSTHSLTEKLTLSQETNEIQQPKEVKSGPQLKLTPICKRTRSIRKGMMQEASKEPSRKGEKNEVTPQKGGRRGAPKRTLKDTTTATKRKRTTRANALQQQEQQSEKQTTDESQEDDVTDEVNKGKENKSTPSKGRRNALKQTPKSTTRRKTRPQASKQQDKSEEEQQSDPPSEENLTKPRRKINSKTKTITATAKNSKRVTKKNSKEQQQIEEPTTEESDPGEDNDESETEESPKKKRKKDSSPKTKKSPTTPKEKKRTVKKVQSQQKDGSPNKDNLSLELKLDEAESTDISKDEGKKKRSSKNTRPKRKKALPIIEIENRMYFRGSIDPYEIQEFVGPLGPSSSIKSFQSKIPSNLETAQSHSDFMSYYYSNESAGIEQHVDKEKKDDKKDSDESFVDEYSDSDDDSSIDSIVRRKKKKLKESKVPKVSDDNKATDKLTGIEDSATTKEGEEASNNQENGEETNEIEKETKTLKDFCSKYRTRRKARERKGSYASLNDVDLGTKQDSKTDEKSEDFHNSKKEQSQSHSLVDATFDLETGDPDNPDEVSNSGPQVEVINGEIVVTEASLLPNPESRKSSAQIDKEFTTVVEDDSSNMGAIQANYNSYLVKPRQIPKTWSAEETKLFYRALRQCGADLSMMEMFLKGRTRAQLKRKFKLEQRKNARLVDMALDPKSRTRLDLSVFGEDLEIPDKPHQACLDTKAEQKGLVTPSESPGPGADSLVEETSAEEKTECLNGRSGKAQGVESKFDHLFDEDGGEQKEEHDSEVVVEEYGEDNKTPTNSAPKPSDTVSLQSKKENTPKTTPPSEKSSSKKENTPSVLPIAPIIGRKPNASKSKKPRFKVPLKSKSKKATTAKR